MRTFLPIAVILVSARPRVRSTYNRARSLTYTCLGQRAADYEASGAGTTLRIARVGVASGLLCDRFCGHSRHGFGQNMAYTNGIECVFNHDLPFVVVGGALQLREVPEVRTPTNTVLGLFKLHGTRRVVVWKVITLIGGRISSCR